MTIANRYENGDCYCDFDNLIIFSRFNIAIRTLYLVRYTDTYYLLYVLDTALG